MRTLTRRLRALIPSSIAARGFLLIVLVAASIGMPAYVTGRLLLRHAREQLDDQRATFLSLALAAHLESDPEAHDQDQWLQRIYAQSQRVRWAALLDRDGRGVEFRRRTAMPRDQIIAQIDLAAREPTSRALDIDGLRSQRFELLTIPQPEQDVVLAVMLDRQTPAGAGPAAAIVAACVAGLIGLVLAAAWLQLGIQRPLKRLGQRLRSLQQGLAEAALHDSAPDELAGLVEAMTDMRHELAKWRCEAAHLRHSTDSQVDARTRRAAAAQRRAERDARTDPLTRLFNRRTLEREGPQIFAAQQNSRVELSVILIDVNNFKQLNDTRGHREGDGLLSFVGDLILSSVRKGTDLATRFGGDEFVLVLPGTGVTEACAVARRIIALFAQRVRGMDDVTPPPGLSAGVAGRRVHSAPDWETLLKMADTAMYYAKRTGCGVATFDEAETAVRSGRPS